MKPRNKLVNKLALFPFLFFPIDETVINKSASMIVDLGYPEDCVNRRLNKKKLWWDCQSPRINLFNVLFLRAMFLLFYVVLTKDALRRFRNTSSY